MSFPRRPIAKTSASVSVLVTSTAVVARNLDRLELTIVNLDATNPIFLVLETVEGTNPTATTAGLRLGAGGSWTTTSFTGAVAGIATGGTVSTNVTEI
jgi:hypothetical protein